MGGGGGGGVVLNVASVLSCADMDCAVVAARDIMIGSYGFECPTTSLLQSLTNRQGIPAMPSLDGLLLWAEKFIEPHWARATAIESSPLEGLARNVRHNLWEAVQWMASFSGDSHSLVSA